MTKREMIIAGVGFGLGVATGGGVAFLITRKRMTLSYEKMMHTEYEAMGKIREHYAKKEEELQEEKRKIANQPKPNLETVGDLAEVGTIIKEGRYSEAEQEAINEAAEVEEREIQNTAPIQSDTPEWDYSVEIKNRRADRPYVIHKDEYMEERDPEVWQSGYLTYYEGDDVLADEHDKIIDADRESVVGDANLSMFGHGSKDPDTVYVRNEVMTIDIEIHRSRGTYAAEVHGFLEHTEPRRRHIPKLRYE